jgi:hypothetical protein
VRVERHRRAAERHDEAARHHEQAASYWAKARRPLAQSARPCEGVPHTLTSRPRLPRTTGLSRPGHPHKKPSQSKFVVVRAVAVPADHDARGSVWQICLTAAIQARARSGTGFRACRWQVGRLAGLSGASRGGPERGSGAACRSFGRSPAPRQESPTRPLRDQERTSFHTKPLAPSRPPPLEMVWPDRRSIRTPSRPYGDAGVDAFLAAFSA